VKETSILNLEDIVDRSQFAGNEDSKLYALAIFQQLGGVLQSGINRIPLNFEAPKRIRHDDLGPSLR
jgi:hypothetical protein